MGAVATGGVRVLNDEIVRGLGISEHGIDAAVARELQELGRRERLYRGGRRRRMSRHGPSFWWMTGWRPEPRCGLPSRR